MVQIKPRLKLLDGGRSDVPVDGVYVCMCHFAFANPFSLRYVDAYQASVQTG